MFPISIDFLVNLALNLALKIHQKSTQEGPKIYKKKHMLDVVFDYFFIDFGSLLGGFLVDFGCQIEGQVNKKMRLTGSTEKRDFLILA